MNKLVLLSILALGVLTIFAPSLADAAKPNLVIMPKNVFAGDDITITGANFPPTSTVEIFLDGKKIADYETGRKGSFTTTITIPDDIKTGSHRIKVSSADTSASENFEVKKSKTSESKSSDKQKTKQAKPTQKTQPMEDILSEIEQQKTPKTDQSKRLVNISDKSGSFQIIPNRDRCDKMLEDYVVSVRWVTDVKDGTFHVLYDVNGKNEIAQIPKGGIKSGSSGLTVHFSGKFAPGEYNFGLSYNNFWVEDSIVKVVIPAPDCAQVQTQGDVGSGQGTGTENPSEPYQGMVTDKNGKYNKIGRDLCDDEPKDYQLKFEWAVIERASSAEFRVELHSENGKYSDSLNTRSKSGYVQLEYEPVPFGTYYADLFIYDVSIPDSRITITIPKPNCADQTQNGYINTGNTPPVKKDIKTSPTTPQTPIPQIPEPTTKHVKTGNTPSTKTPEDSLLTCTPSNAKQWTCTESETKTSKKSESFRCALSEDNSLTCTSSGAQEITLNCPVNYYDATIKAWQKCGIIPRFQPSGTTNQGQISSSGSNTIKIQSKHGTAVQHNTNLCDSDPMDYRVMLLWVIDTPGLSARDFRVNPTFPLKSLYHSDHKLESGELKQQIFATPGNHEYELTYKGITVANSKIYVTIPTPNCGGQTQTGSTGYKITDKTPSQIRDTTKSPPTGSTNPSTPDPQKSTAKSTTTGNKAILVPKTGSSAKPSTGTGLK